MPTGPLAFPLQFLYLLHPPSYPAYAVVHHRLQVVEVDGEPVITLIDGVVRGLLPSGTPVTKGMKSGDVDPRSAVEHCFTVSDKARAIAGGVLEAILYFKRRNANV